MKVSFHIASETLRTRTREVVVVPCVGEYIAWHTDEGSLHMKVLKVLHTLDDRDDEKPKKQARETVILAVEKVDPSEFSID